MTRQSYTHGQIGREKQERRKYINCHIKVIKLPRIVFYRTNTVTSYHWFNIEAWILNNNKVNACTMT